MGKLKKFGALLSFIVEKFRTIKPDLKDLSDCGITKCELKNKLPKSVKIEDEEFDPD